MPMNVDAGDERSNAGSREGNVSEVYVRELLLRRGLAGQQGVGSGSADVYVGRWSSCLRTLEVLWGEESDNMEDYRQLVWVLDAPNRCIYVWSADKTESIRVQLTGKTKHINAQRGSLQLRGTLERDA